jgi:hypothetical protein
MKNYLLFLGDHGYTGPKTGTGGHGGATRLLYERPVVSGDLSAQTFVFGSGNSRATVSGSTIRSNFGGTTKRATLNRNKVELDIFVVAGASADDKVGNDWTVETSEGSGTYEATGTSTVAGKRYRMPTTVTNAIAEDGDDFTILKVAGDGGNADTGFTLTAGDKIEMKIADSVTGREWLYDYSFMVCYPEDAFLSVEPTAATTSDIKFRCHTGQESVDIITVEHGSGKHKELADLIAACLHAGSQGNKYAGSCLVMDTFRNTTFKGLGQAAGIVGYTIATNQ